MLGARVHEIAVLLTVCCGDVRAGSTALGHRVPALGGCDAIAAALHCARSLSLCSGGGGCHRRSLCIYTVKVAWAQLYPSSEGDMPALSTSYRDSTYSVGCTWAAAGASIR